MSTIALDTRSTRAVGTRRTSAVSVFLWILQCLVAALFLFAGGMKLVVPFATMSAQMPVALPADFIHFIGVVEVVGALGLILPGLTRIRPILTPIAAAGLALIMAGAVGFTLGSQTPGFQVPAVAGICAAVIAIGRSLVAPHADRRR
jgi:uncharacterized membrane protein YphA (DoxX/SURF4 family)